MIQIMSLLHTIKTKIKLNINNNNLNNSNNTTNNFIQRFYRKTKSKTKGASIDILNPYKTPPIDELVQWETTSVGPHIVFTAKINEHREQSYHFPDIVQVIFEFTPDIEPNKICAFYRNQWGNSDAQSDFNSIKEAKKWVMSKYINDPYSDYNKKVLEYISPRAETDKQNIKKRVLEDFYK